MGRPCPLDPAGDRVAADAARGLVVPAETLFVNAGGFGLRTEQGGVAIAVGLAHRVAAGGQRHGFFVVHRHTGEGFAHVMGGFQGVGHPVYPFRVDVDQAHLDGGERVFERFRSLVALIAVAVQPFGFWSPVDVFFRRPDVLTAEGEPEGLQAH